MIEWKDAYATGNISIDKQHRLLFDFFNDFEQLIGEGKGILYLNKCFPMLEAYAQAHFKFEERCMQEHHCPVAHKNVMAHQLFIEKVEEYKKIFQSGQVEDDFFLDMHQFLENWIKGHIIGIDVHLKACIKD